jgi:hypothetical protein
LAETITVQFFQLDNVPAIEVALIEREYDPAAVGVPDKVVPDQATPAETTDRVEDSLTVGVYEYTEPIFPVVPGLLVNVGAHLAEVTVFSVVAPGDNLLSPSALPTPEHDLKEMLGILDGLNKNPIPYWGPNVPSPLTVPAGFCPLYDETQFMNCTPVSEGRSSRWKPDSQLYDAEQLVKMMFCTLVFSHMSKPTFQANPPAAPHL